MKKFALCAVLWLGLLGPGLFASTATCSWGQVVTLSDGSPLPSGVTVRFKVYRAFRVDLADSIQVGDTTSLSFVDNTAPRKTTCYYFVKAYILPGVESSRSDVGRFFTNKP